MGAGSHYDESAARLAAVAAITDEALIATDARGLITEWNAAAEHLLGYTAAEMLGRPFSAVVTLPSAHGLTSSAVDVSAHRKNGQTMAMSLSIAPVRGADGQPAGAVYGARDPDAKARDFRDAKRLAAIVESSDDAIVSKDLNGIIVSWNDAAQRMFGYTADEAIGKSIRMLIPDDRQAEEDEVLSRIRRGARLDHFETIRQRKDGSLLPISLTVSPIFDDDGRVIGASKIARDISDWKRLNQSLQDANRLKDEFLATLSHELRTPLNAILGYANMIKSGAVASENQQRAIDTIERNARSLTKLVEDVLDVSRIISGKMRLHIQSVNVGDVVRHAAEGLLPAAGAKGVRLETSIGDNLPVMQGDADRVQQIAWNLISNAVKFTPRGGHIGVDVRRIAKNIEIVVRDDGVGVSSAFMPHLFERFRQGESGIRRPGGLGLGLNISKQLVELHGGTISAESKGEGKGTTFRVTFPV
jgi:PAS domain S-box-containing protein